MQWWASSIRCHIFRKKAWDKFSKETDSGNAWNLYNGIISSTGLGDGNYPVYANKERTAFMISFM
jgi:hypothetical protein